jgi:hypothetical protein
VKQENLLLSSAYFPPVHYMALISGAENTFIEKEENYLKQTYRNRCIILSATGPIILSVPVFMGSLHKVRIKDIKIDYSKRWQKLHLRGINSSYRSSPFFEYYFHHIEAVINSNHEWLIDLNMHSLRVVTELLRCPALVSYTAKFQPVSEEQYDFRYQISPKKELPGSIFNFREYYQVFSDRTGFVPALSILDLLFNIGPDAPVYLEKIRKK